jgi:hypothetical protein
MRESESVTFTVLSGSASRREQPGHAGELWKELALEIWHLEALKRPNSSKR